MTAPNNEELVDNSEVAAAEVAQPEPIEAPTQESTDEQATV